MAGVMSTVLGIVVWLFMLAGWTIDLAGVGRLTWLCMERHSDFGMEVRPLGDNSEQELECGYIYAYSWWTIALQFFVICLVLVSVFTTSINKGLIAAVVAISTVQLTQTADYYVHKWRDLDLAEDHDAKLGRTGEGASAVVAGKVIELVFNYIWLIVFAKFVHAEGAPAADAAKPASA